MDESLNSISAGEAPETPSIEPAPAAPEPPRGTRTLMKLAIIALVVVVLIYVAHRYTSQQLQSLGGAGGENAAIIGQAAPDFTVKDIHGNAFQFSDLKGKVVLLDFWATWCGPCKAEIPWFIDLYNQYKAQGFEVVGVSMDEEGPDVVRSFVEKNRMNYPVVMGNDKVATQFGGIFGLPTTFIIGRDGKIASMHTGLTSRDKFEAAIKKLL